MGRVDSLEKTDAGRDWGQEEKGTTENEMAGWRHRLDAHEFKLWELVMDREAWHAVVHEVAWGSLRVSDAIQPSHSLSSPSPPAPNPAQHQSLFQRVNSSHDPAPEPSAKRPGS